MKAAGAILGVVLALAAGYFVFKYEFRSTPGSGASPAQAIDVTGVKSDLLAIGQAERAYLTSKGSYASLDQLHQDGDLLNDLLGELMTCVPDWNKVQRGEWPPDNPRAAQTPGQSRP